MPMTRQMMEKEVEQVLKKWVNRVNLFNKAQTALLHVKKDNNEISVFLIEECAADVLAKDNEGLNVLHKAATENNSYMLTYLREKCRMNMEMLDNAKHTPLHYACAANAHFAIQWLLGFGADINAQSKYGQTPLHLLMS